MRLHLRTSRKHGKAKSAPAAPAGLEVPSTVPFNPTPALVRSTSADSNGLVRASVQKTVQLYSSDGKMIGLWAYILAVRNEDSKAVHIAIISLRDPTDASACVTQRFLEPGTPTSFRVSACKPPARMRYVNKDDAGKMKDILLRKIDWQNVEFKPMLSKPETSPQSSRTASVSTKKKAPSTTSARTLTVPAPQRAVAQVSRPNPQRTPISELVMGVPLATYTLAMGSPLAGPPRILGVPFSASIHRKIDECDTFCRCTGSTLGILSHYRAEGAIIHIVLRSKRIQPDYWHFDTAPTNVTVVIPKGSLNYPQEVSVLDEWGKYHPIKVVVASLSIRRIQAG